MPRYAGVWKEKKLRKHIEVKVADHEMEDLFKFFRSESSRKSRKKNSTASFGAWLIIKF